MSDLSVETISSLDALTRLTQDWRALEASIALDIPFLSLDWALAWWSHLHESRLGVRDSLQVRAVRTRAGGLVGVAPIMITSRPGFDTFSGRQLQFFGSDPNITEVRGLLARPEDTGAVYEALFDDFQARAADWDWMVMSAPAQPVDIGASLMDRFPGCAPVRDIPDYLLRLEPTWEQFKAKLGRNIKESLRRCNNAPKRDGVRLDFEVISNQEPVSEALRPFFELHRDRAEANAAVQHNNVFASAASRRFLVDVCERFARRGAFRLFRLRSGDRIVATRIGFALADKLYLYYSGYDQTFAQYSVMTTLVARTIQHAIQDGFLFVNLSTGNDVSKTRWSPEVVHYRDWLTISPSLRGRLAFQVSTKLRDWFAGRRLPKALADVFARRAD